MKKLEGRLKAETYELAVKESRATRVQEWAVMLAFVLIVTPIELAIFIQKMLNYKTYTDHYPLFDVLLLVRSLTKAAIDSFVFFVFMRSFRYFIDMKKVALIEKYGKEEGRLTGYNRFIISSAYVLFALNSMNSLLSVTLWAVYHSSIVPDNSPNLDDYNYWYKVCFRTFKWLVNFMTFLALLHLFHYQGARTRQSMY